ncbi:MAG: N-acetyl-gamma-glutamyl-phosphate reductase [Proteobacteria bacterium]|nr:N-acetyl-gamma-glutamyl-phosphate reductase [Pseudomonadota bacterium]
MTARVFIDGEAGTTGLQISARLEDRDDVELLHLADGERKDPAKRADLLNAADLVILCLPDDAVIEALRLIDNPAVKVIDASIAHRTDPDWVYGMAEYAPEQPRRIAEASRVTNPGCYAIGAIALIRPLVARGVLPADFPVTINAISGYSGGGRKLIEAYEDPKSPGHVESTYRAYALSLEHKHTEEMRVHGLLAKRPLFVPSVGRFRQGMMVQVPLQLWALPGSPSAGDVHEALADYYDGQSFITVADRAATAAITHLDPEALNGTNELRLHVFGNDSHEQAVLVAVLDNLGKGASGSAVQNMNLMLDLAPQAGLETRLVA